MLKFSKHNTTHIASRQKNHVLKRKSRIVLAFLSLHVLFFLNGCKIYDNYQKVDVQSVVSSYDKLVQGGEELQPEDLLQSLSLPDDASLQQLIDSALLHNTDLRIAQTRIDVAAARLRQSKLAFLPDLQMGVQGGGSFSPNANPSWSHSELFSASWEIDIFGKLRNQKMQQQMDYAAALDYRQAVRTGLCATVAISFYTLSMLHNEMQLSEQTLVNWQEDVRVLKAMKEGGMTTEAAVAQAEANALRVEGSLIHLKQEIKELENTLSALIGLPSNQFVASLPLPPFEKVFQSVKEKKVDSVPLQMLGNRPDVRRAEKMVARAFYATNAARSAFYPSLTLSGSAGWSNLNGSLNPADMLANAVGSLVQPLFKKGQLTANLKVAQAQQEEAQHSFVQVLLDASAEVNNALSGLESARAKCEVDAQQVARLEDAVHSTHLLMENSTTSYLEVLTAQQSLLSARLSLLADQFEQVQRYVTLYRALGGGQETGKGL